MEVEKIKWDHFDILATEQSDIHCKIKETLLIRDLKPALNENVGSEKLLQPFIELFFCKKIPLSRRVEYVMDEWMSQ